MRFDELEKERQRNRTLAQEKFSERISVIKNCIDTQHQYVELFFGLLEHRHLTQHGDAEKPIFSAVIKNEIALYSSLILTLDGLFAWFRFSITTISLRSFNDCEVCFSTKK